jgi:hypothetical protein
MTLKIMNGAFLFCFEHSLLFLGYGDIAQAKDI